MNKNLTPEEKADSEKRIAEFRAEYVELVKKHEVDLMAYPQYTQLETGAFNTFVTVLPIDVRKRDIVSPIQPDSEGVIKES